MSHIDSFRHELVGRLGALPVYHPLEVIEGEFQATPHQLVFGGGSGEHPALVFTDPAGAVAFFLQRELTSLQEFQATHGTCDEPLVDRAEVWLPIVTAVAPTRAEDLIDAAEWEEEEWQQWEENSQSPLLPNRRWEETSFAEWLALGVGEFVFAAMPELALELGEKLPGWRETRLVHMRYNNILAIPPGLPVYANGGNRFGRPD